MSTLRAAKWQGGARGLPPPRLDLPCTQSEPISITGEGPGVSRSVSKTLQQPTAQHKAFQEANMHMKTDGCKELVRTALSMAASWKAKRVVFSICSWDVVGVLLQNASFEPGIARTFHVGRSPQ